MASEIQVIFKQVHCGMTYLPMSCGLSNGGFIAMTMTRLVWYWSRFAGQDLLLSLFMLQTSCCEHLRNFLVLKLFISYCRVQHASNIHF